MRTRPRRDNGTSWERSIRCGNADMIEIGGDDPRSLASFRQFLDEAANGTREDRGEGHARATSSAAATRSPSRRRAPSRAESSSVAPGPASASGTRPGEPAEARRLAPRAGRGRSSRRRRAPASSSPAVRASVAIGVSAPRNRMRQPCERRTSANASRVMSCVSPGAQERSASGPLPRSQNRASAKEPAAGKVSREVLLADLDLAALPAVADLFQGGQHNVAQRPPPGQTQQGSRRAPSERRPRRSGRSPRAGEWRRPRADPRTGAGLPVCDTGGLGG